MSCEKGKTYPRVISSQNQGSNSWNNDHNSKDTHFLQKKSKSQTSLKKGMKATNINGIQSPVNTRPSVREEIGTNKKGNMLIDCKGHTLIL